MAILAGFGGRITVNGTVLRAHHWSVDWKVEDFDITTFENFGVGSYLPGLIDADVTFDAYYDTVDNPFSAPIAIAPGTYDALVITYIKGNAAITWTLPNVLCVTVHSETGVRDVIRYTYTGKFSGTGTSGVAVITNQVTPPSAS